MSDETMEDMDVDATMGDNVKDGDERKRGRVFYKRKICRFCSQKLVVNYKDPASLKEGRFCHVELQVLVQNTKECSQLRSKELGLYLFYLL